MRKGGLEPEKALEMIDEFFGPCCTEWHGVAPFGPWGPNEHPNGGSPVGMATLILFVPDWWA